MASITSVRNVPEFTKDHIYYTNEEALRQKINALIKGGTKNLQIVTDFDYTLTKRTTNNGEDVMSTFSVFWECPSISEEYRVKDQELAAKYRPYERNNSLSLAEKTRYMEEWYNEANKNLRGVTFPSGELMDIGHTMVQHLRSGVKTLLSWAQKEEVPVLVFSAGLADSITAIMTAADILYPNVKVISNFLEVNKAGQISGIRGTIIHTLNKKEAAIKGTEYYDMVKERRNVILMGDSIGDATMADGIEQCNVLKIGFLEDHTDYNLKKYLDHFDVVLVKDGTFNVVNAVLNLIKQVE